MPVTTSAMNSASVFGLASSLQAASNAAAPEMASTRVCFIELSLKGFNKLGQDALIVGRQRLESLGGAVRFAVVGGDRLGDAARASVVQVALGEPQADQRSCPPFGRRGPAIGEPVGERGAHVVEQQVAVDRRVDPGEL